MSLSPRRSISCAWRHTAVTAQTPPTGLDPRMAPRLWAGAVHPARGRLSRVGNDTSVSLTLTSSRLRKGTRIPDQA